MAETYFEPAMQNYVFLISSKIEFNRQSFKCFTFAHVAWIKPLSDDIIFTLPAVFENDINDVAKCGRSHGFFGKWQFVDVSNYYYGYLFCIGLAL